MVFPESITAAERIRYFGKYAERLLLTLLAAFAIALACSGQQRGSGRRIIPRPYLDADAYAIYAVLLKSTGGSNFVVQAETDSWSKTTSKNIGIRGDRNFRKVWGAVVNDFAEQYRRPRLLVPNIPITGHYDVASLEKILSGGWDGFHERFPWAGGRFYSFSPVGFNSQRNRAIVNMTCDCGPLCGGGTTHFFEKQDGTWREVSVNAQVLAWAS
jgi:hypothetical protein